MDKELDVPMVRVRPEWDTDGVDVDLPETILVPVTVHPDEIADWLSDGYGWCVISWDYA